MTTKKLSNGFTVLANDRSGVLRANDYCNRTRAEAAAAKVGPQAQVWQRGNCFYVITEIAIGLE